MCILKQRKKPKPNLLIMKSQSKRFAVINQDGMAVIILDTKAEAEKEANQPHAATQEHRAAAKYESRFWPVKPVFSSFGHSRHIWTPSDIHRSCARIYPASGILYLESGIRAFIQHSKFIIHNSRFSPAPPLLKKPGAITGSQAPAYLNRAQPHQTSGGPHE